MIGQNGRLKRQENEDYLPTQQTNSTNSMMRTLFLPVRQKQRKMITTISWLRKQHGKRRRGNKSTKHPRRLRRRICVEKGRKYWMRLGRDLLHDRLRRIKD